MSQINIPNDYPVELPVPDFSPYARGNTGISFVWRFESGAPGLDVMVSAIVHEYEPCGAIAPDRLLRTEIRPDAGLLTRVFMNVAAYRAFDPEDPNRPRWMDDVLDRDWDEGVLEGDPDGIELRRARAVRPVLEGIDYLLDLHSMQLAAPPLMLSGRHAKGRELAAKVGVPVHVVGDAGDAAGRCLRD